MSKDFTAMFAGSMEPADILKKIDTANFTISTVILKTVLGPAFALALNEGIRNG